MDFKVKQSPVNGVMRIPASKSHTIRAAAIASMAKGASVIHNPLISADTMACYEAIKALGADVSGTDTWTIKGLDGHPALRAPGTPIDVKNSGTTLSILTSIAALSSTPIELDGDESIRSRPLQPLLTALKGLGAQRAESKLENGSAPIVVQGPVMGGNTSVDGTSSQFVTSLLLAAPLMRKNCDIRVSKLNEKPYVEMTLWWLKMMGIEYKQKGGRQFLVPGRQTYFGFEKSIPADFSSATFPIVAALIAPGSDVLLKGLDMNDPQGDKAVIALVQEMSGAIEVTKEGIRVKSSELEGMEIDLNAMPDALPALAVLGCCATGETEITNVPQARIKETDRIKVMCEELTKMGANIKELEDGLVIKQSSLHGAHVDGHGDHRVVMALALAGMIAEGETVISTAESAAVTFPDFQQKMQALGADIQAG
ncbi:MAG: 3-phosphoshikimate 1-carboxyvinyltransferase [Candidatus Raymondbacteria bacterium RifOxyC12_full_50_8]|uniref:3-phosphoshikimate 1-carboxyvinyltransferase n=1 Tax=Candidatus Raymondbacteria bacterium RIFOXYD12_FULL_49_13 TaxID=1817890 RepID=A0A1F7F057_UNCRA|nr:MAG: 3-phosphoshikimate 1-carboxyvinyltransferase [Candidatus Raymondbacteria bacterium RifOxyB12_full_50_8]OGJ93381.1 MAG: 3-phosphoshikimate 1-carboxyvinyltransferase [Candidatus Raymondbacteria bacterium RIFOXYA2_FULL_49_16]OGJ98482.1 MAG: 3-phosphoshikimate 1-carboxyvinyltransferase [Candidatus Raymondbacteria bacterium RifOxyC12_full_50_8]OGK00029.1 MAG: 3-phosphoshikimate 1-carboxyvinyltransferase [Candidatus Raymondbacteria bacterium RIFOXYD12_FULL_49_13]OGP45018.1 MAG: 3-phosphoshiki